VENFLKNTPRIYTAETLISHLKTDEIGSVKQQLTLNDSEGLLKANNDVEAYLSNLDEPSYKKTLQSLPLQKNQIYESGLSLFQHKIPTWIFIIVCFYLAMLAWKHNLSLIPLLGLVCCLYMMSEMGITNWIGFTIWLGVGLIIYFGYSYKNSKLNRA
jgi:hypothetical protein